MAAGTIHRLIGQQSAGMGIREAGTLVTNNTSRFVPHLIA
ncbi:glutathionylspermidine synthase family protein [Deminuibacter soli]|nr:glutathionylspermidine synthase family protein [Deminuibacter soli]